MAVKRQIVMGAASLAALYVGVTNALGLGEMQLDSQKDFRRRMYWFL